MLIIWASYLLVLIKSGPPSPTTILALADLPSLPESAHNDAVAPSKPALIVRCDLTAAEPAHPRNAYDVAGSTHAVLKPGSCRSGWINRREEAKCMTCCQMPAIRPPSTRMTLPVI